MCRAARACRRPTSPSSNCRNWSRRRFSWFRRHPRWISRPTGEIKSVNGIGVHRARLELVADAGAQVVGLNQSVLDRQEADVFPFTPHKNIAPQQVFRTETGSPAGNEGVSSFFLKC